MSAARDAIEAEMIRELIARRQSLLRAKEQLLKAAEEISYIDGKLAVIAEELTAYGHTEPAAG